MDITVEEQERLKLKHGVDRLLGKGSFGTVYKKEFRNGQVAVKRIQRLDLENDRDEGIIMQQCNDHPNVLKLIAIFLDNDFQYVLY